MQHHDLESKVVTKTTHSRISHPPYAEILKTKGGRVGSRSFEGIKTGRQ